MKLEKELIELKNSTTKVEKKEMIEKNKLERYLYDYPNIKLLIKSRREELIDTGNVTYYEWITKTSSIDDIIDRLDNDILIKEYEYMEKIIKEALKYFKTAEPKFYDYIIKKYFDQISNYKLTKIFSDKEISLYNKKIVKKILWRI